MTDRAVTETGRGSDGTDAGTPAVRQRGTAVPPPTPVSATALYHVPRSQVWEGSRGRQTGRVHLHVDGRAICGVRDPWYPRPPLATEERCFRCVARAERLNYEWPGRGPQP